MQSGSAILKSVGSCPPYTPAGAHVMELPMYWASCATGLQSCLFSEREKVDDYGVLWFSRDSSNFPARLEAMNEVQIVPDSLTQGGALFHSSSNPKELAKLRSADNLYAFLGHYKDLPLDKEPAVEYLTSLASKIDWKPALELYNRWQHVDDLKSASPASPNDGDSVNNNGSEKQLSFRVTTERICKNLRKQGYTSMHASAALGDGIQELLGWKANMRGYNVEVLAWIRDMELLLVLALLYSSDKTSEKKVSKEVDDQHNAVVEKILLQKDVSEATNLTEERTKANDSKLQRPSRSEAQLHSRRHYRKALVGTSLKPSTAFALLQLAQIRPGHIVLDPMCGCGTIPLEAVDWLGGRVMGLAGDNSSKAVDAAMTNAAGRTSGTGGPCDVLQWDAANLPLRSGTVDRVVCDMPFGNRCGNFKVREWLCPKVVKEVVRVLQTGAGMAVLMAQSKTMRQEVEVTQKSYLALIQHLLIDMEGLIVEVYVVRRTMEPPPIQMFKPKKSGRKRQRNGGQQQQQQQPKLTNIIA